jgi:hypothetical protein
LPDVGIALCQSIKGLVDGPQLVEGELDTQLGLFEVNTF